jgi:hypothetical protein
MATKKKAARRKSTKRAGPNPNTCALEIQIMSNGNVVQFAYLDGNGKKHPSMVYWQAMDLTKTYQIVLTPPSPFTDPTILAFSTSQNGATDIFTVDKKAKGSYGYTVIPPAARGNLRKMSAGGIISDSDGPLLLARGIRPALRPFTSGGGIIVEA